MHEATIVVPVDGVNYQIRRMTPAVGSYIWQRLMAAVYKASEGSKEEVAEPEDKKAPRPSDADRLRAMCGVAFMYLGFDDFEFVQKNCMRMLSREEPSMGYIPVVADSGQWAAKDLEANPFAITRLMVEVLVINLASFLESGTAAPTAK
jgi:hypothetical protein